LIYRDGDLIGRTKETFFSDELRIPSDTHTYSIVGLSSVGSETLSSSIESIGQAEFVHTVLPAEELVNREFIETLADLAIGNPFFLINDRQYDCAHAHRQTLHRDNNRVDWSRYMFDCKFSSGTSSGIQSHMVPISWGGHYHSWFAKKYDYTSYRFRSSDDKHLSTISRGEIDSGNGGGGVPFAKCGDSWRSSHRERKQYDIESYTSLSDEYRLDIENAQGSVMRESFTAVKFAESDELINCVQQRQIRAQSRFELSDSRFGVDLNVELSVFFYLENPPIKPEAEHYTLTIALDNGDVVVVSYPEIGSTLATVTYPKNGSLVSVEIETAAAPFVNHLLY